MSLPSIGNKWLLENRECTRFPVIVFVVRLSLVRVKHNLERSWVGIDRVEISIHCIIHKWKPFREHALI